MVAAWGGDGGACQNERSEVDVGDTTSKLGCWELEGSSGWNLGPVLPDPPAGEPQGRKKTEG